MVKKYLNNRKYNSKPIIFSDFLNEFRMKMKALCNLYKQEGVKNMVVEMVLKLNELI